MNTSSRPIRGNAPYELRFRSLFKPGRGYSFPCDAAGHVDVDALNDGERDSYFYARATIGAEFAMPAVLPSDLR
jgi:hypothetical protein